MPATSDDTEIRRAGRADTAAWRRAVDSLLADTQAVESDPETALASDACYAYLAFADDAPVGLLGAYRLPGLTGRGPLVYLYDIVVAPGRRGEGVGRALIDALLEACRRDGVRVVWAGTDAGNAAARSLFEASGARPNGESYSEYEWRLAR